MDRFQEIPTDGPMCDLVWSDPHEQTGWATSFRGAGFNFGPDVTEQFNHNNGLKQIARAHQLVMDGYLSAHSGNIGTFIFTWTNLIIHFYYKLELIESDYFLCT